MHLPRPAVAASMAALVALGALAACDKDPTAAQETFALTACPTGLLQVSAPITLNFSAPISASTVPGNIVVTNAITGVEIPGTLAVQGTSTIVFQPSSRLPFQTPIRVRAQNLLSELNTPAPLAVCELTTVPPPITQLFWDQLPQVSGNRLLGGSMFAADSGFVATAAVPVFRRVPSGWQVIFNQPYFNSSFDAAVPTKVHGFASHLDSRTFQGVITETRDGGGTFDSVFAVPGEVMQRLFFRQRGPGIDDLFGVAGGGSVIRARFVKYRPETRVFESVATFSNTGQVSDISFATDTAVGDAVSNGLRFASGTINPGRVYHTTDGGVTWTEITNAVANDVALSWMGVARRNNGQIYVTGGSGYVLRLTPSGGGYTVTRILENAVTNPDSTNFQALQYTDVEFAPDNDQKGWIVGAQLVSATPPRFQGVIFETVNGGQTWTRQGVRGAPSDGAEFPRLNRIIAFSANSAWLLGDGGVVLTYKP